MRRKRKIRKLSKASVLCITAIISLGLMGVGYGMWSDTLHINLGIETGNAATETEIEKSIYKDINFSIRNEDNIIKFSGEVYPDFKDNIKIIIRDTGTVPLRFNGIDEDGDNEISELSTQIKDKYGLFTSIIKDDVLETFNLSISPPEDDIENILMHRSMFNSQIDQKEMDEIQCRINELERDIQELEQEMDKLNVTEKYDFRYILNFIQGI